MSNFQRIKSFIAGLFILLFALILFIIPENGCYIVAAVLTIMLFVYGFRQIWFYFSMARHMVGGKSTLYRGIIALDIALFISSSVAFSDYIVMFYLIFFYAFYGFIDVLRAFEAKFNGASLLNFKLITGILSILFAIALLVIGIIIGDKEVVVYGYCLMLVYSAVVRIVTAFRKPSIVYIQ